jgi:F-type H+-transporting ATPase subunit alpha
MAEHMMYAGKDTLVIYDDLTKQAQAYRQLEAVDLAQQLAPVGEAWPGAGVGAARRGDELEARIAGDRRDVLVGGDLAEADDGDL